jgi:hypothetical protein
VLERLHYDVKAAFGVNAQEIDGVDLRGRPLLEGKDRLNSRNCSHDDENPKHSTAAATTCDA